MIYIVGIGPGSKEYILPKAQQVIKTCDVVLGFERAISSIEHDNKSVIKSLAEVLNHIRDNKGKDIAIVASGDPCFYGINDYINKNYEEKVQVIPGISSFQYLMAKLNKSWQGAMLGSLHGRKEEFIQKIEINKLSIWLTDKENSPDFICRELIRNNIKALVYVGINLSYEDELIVSGTERSISEMKFSELSVVVIETLE
ncbi:MAG: precorrin-6y C5,15-methyltransferase (decarboxylating) subunit CbiE [Clostridiaceae bacterium]|nr:precorrin-6y C5,15-methyltransferase (decarboxylating) subunit CbiE [Clostridiaceae bacterium]